MKIQRITAAALACALLAACGNGVSTDNSLTESGGNPISTVDNLVEGGGIGIAREVPGSPYSAGVLKTIPVYDSTNSSSFQVDLRGADIRADLSGELENLRYSLHDTNTRWPDSLPEGYSPALVLENGKNPGLGVRSLHEAGIDGRGIGVAVIDQTLLTGHREYADRLRHYEEYHLFQIEETMTAEMHGPAVASLAVGETTGVAPGADLYYIAASLQETLGANEKSLTYAAQAINRLLDLNSQLPESDRIRVISMSLGLEPGEGYDEAMAAVERAKKEGVFVISTSLYETHGWEFGGLDRDPMGDPDDPDAYSMGIFHRQSYDPANDWLAEALFLPMDSRTFASWTGENDYSYGAPGGWSWAVPYLAGLYAMAAQVKPDVTPELFWQTAMETSRHQEAEVNGAPYTINHLVDPVGLITALQSAA